jgi:hypothetical protein
LPGYIWAAQTRRGLRSLQEQIAAHQSMRHGDLVAVSSLYIRTTQRIPTRSVPSIDRASGTVSIRVLLTRLYSITTRVAP